MKKAKSKQGSDFQSYYGNGIFQPGVEQLPLSETLGGWCIIKMQQVTRNFFLSSKASLRMIHFVNSLQLPHSIHSTEKSLKIESVNPVSSWILRKLLKGSVSPPYLTPNNRADE